MTATARFAATARHLFHVLVYRKLGETLLGRSRRRESSVVSQELIGLMQGLQLHRGLSGAVLDGERAFSDDLDAVEQQLSRSLHALAEHHGDNHPMLRDAQWQAVLDQWQSARVNWRELDYYTNLFVHNEIINGLVATLQTLSANFGSHLCPQQGELIRRWPVLIEQLGVLRALGLHYLSHPGSPRDARVRQTLRDYLGYARAGLGRVDPGHADARTLDATRRVLGRVAQMLDDPAGSPTPHDYYVDLTEVIDAWYRDLQRQLGEVH